MREPQRFEARLPAARMEATVAPQRYQAAVLVKRYVTELGEGVPIPGPPGPEGPQGEPGPPGPSSSVFFYKADAVSQSPNDPGAGKIRWNNAVQTAATSLYVDVLTDGDFDASAFYRQTNISPRFTVQDADLSQNYQVWEMTAPAISYPDWFEVPVTFIESGGVGTFAHNSRVAVVLIVEGQPGPQGPQGEQGETGPPGPQGDPASQTPWLSNIDAAGFSLTNASRLNAITTRTSLSGAQAQLDIRAATSSTAPPSIYFVYEGFEAMQLFMRGSGLHVQQPDGVGYAPFAAALIESKSGGFKFPDGTTQVTAAISAIAGRTPPNDSTFTWVNQNSAATSVSSLGVFLSRAGVASDGFYGRARTIPFGTPRTLTCCFIPDIQQQNYNAAGIFIADAGATPKMHVWALGHNAGATTPGFALRAHRYTNPTTFQGTTDIHVLAAPSQYRWLRLRDDGVNIVFSWSNDGVNYLQALSLARTVFLTAPAQWGFALNAYTAAGTLVPVGMTVIDWKEENV